MRTSKWPREFLVETGQFVSKHVTGGGTTRGIGFPKTA